MLKLGETLSKTGNAVAAIQFGMAFKAVARDNLSHVAVKSIYREVRSKAGAICKVIMGMAVDPDEFDESVIVEDFKPYCADVIRHASNAHEILGRFFMECIGQGVVVCIVLAADRSICLVGTDAGDYALFDARTGGYQAFGADEEPLRRYMTQQKGPLTAYFSDSTPVPIVSKELVAQEESGETTVQVVTTDAVVVEEPKKPVTITAPVPTPKKAQVIRKRVAPTAVPASAPESAPKKASSQQSSAVEDE